MWSRPPYLLIFCWLFISPALSYARPCVQLHVQGQNNTVQTSRAFLQLLQQQGYNRPGETATVIQLVWLSRHQVRFQQGRFSQDFAIPARRLAPAKRARTLLLYLENFLEMQEERERTKRFQTLLANRSFPKVPSTMARTPVRPRPVARQTRVTKRSRPQRQPTPPRPKVWSSAKAKKRPQPNRARSQQQRQSPPTPATTKTRAIPAPPRPRSRTARPVPRPPVEKRTPARVRPPRVARASASTTETTTLTTRPSFFQRTWRRFQGWWTRNIQVGDLHIGAALGSDMMGFADLPLLGGQGFAGLALKNNIFFQFNLELFASNWHDTPEVLWMVRPTFHIGYIFVRRASWDFRMSVGGGSTFLSNSYDDDGGIDVSNLWNASLHARINWRISRRSRIFLSLYLGLQQPIEFRNPTTGLVTHSIHSFQSSLHFGWQWSLL